MKSTCDPRMLCREEPSRGFFGYLCCCCYRRPQALVTVTLLNAQGLAKQDLTGAGNDSILGGKLLYGMLPLSCCNPGADPYCKVNLEGKTVASSVCKNTLEPKFNAQMVFYVKKPTESEITIQVRSPNTPFASPSCSPSIVALPPFLPFRYSTTTC